jgi:hypothetical protein
MPTTPTALTIAKTTLGSTSTHALCRSRIRHRLHSTVLNDDYLHIPPPAFV